MSGSRLLGTAIIDNGDPVRAELHVFQDVQEIRSALPRSDPNWSHVDAAGHYHAYSDDEHDHYPTLLVRSEHRDCDGSCGGVCQGEGYHVDKYLCRICQEEQHPGALHGEHVIYRPGRKDWELTVEADVENRQVSVVVRNGDTEHFGIAIGGDRIVTSSPDGIIRYRTHLHGASPLGRRKIPATVARG